MESSGGFSQPGLDEQADDPFAESEREFDEQVPDEAARRVEIEAMDDGELGRLLTTAPEGSVDVRLASDVHRAREAAKAAPAEEPPIVNREGEPVERAADDSPEDAFGEGGELEPSGKDIEPAAVDERAAEQVAARADTSTRADAGATGDGEAAKETAEEAEQRQTVEAGEREAERRTEIEALSPDDLGSLLAQSPERSLDLRLAREVLAERQAEIDAERPTSASSEEPGAVAGSESGAEATAGESEGDDDDGDVAAVPQEKKGGTRRPYLLFIPEGGGRFAELPWYEDKSGKLVPKGTPGAKKQTVTLARGKNQALDHGFRVLGEPDDGASLVAVAASSWSVKRVEPDEEPVRRKLRIR